MHAIQLYAYDESRNLLIGRATIARFSVVLVIFQGDPGQQPTSSGMATRASQHPKSRQLQEPAIASAEDLEQPGMRGAAQLGPGRGGSGGRYRGQFQEAAQPLDQSAHQPHSAGPAAQGTGPLQAAEAKPTEAGGSHTKAHQPAGLQLPIHSSMLFTD